MSRSRGPSITTLVSGAAAFAMGSRSVCCSAGLAPFSLLKVAHPDVTVEACAVLDLQPLHGDVAVDLAGLANRQLVTRRQHTLDVAANRDVRAFDERLDVATLA